MLRFANVDDAMKYAIELSYNQNCQITMSVVTMSHKQHRVTIDANMDWQFIAQANEWEWEDNIGREKLNASPAFRRMLDEADSEEAWAVIQSWYDHADKSAVKFRGVEPVKPAPVTVTRFGGTALNLLKIRRGKVTA